MKQLRLVDFFCGAGGSSAGAEAAGHCVVAAVNHWAVAALTYERNHGLRPLRESCATVNPNDLPPADGLLFSSPCTNHSAARGARPRDEISRSTAWEVVRFAAAMRPRILVVENVPPIRQWPSFGEWIAQIQDLGYHVNTDADGRPGQVLDAANWGVPQNRARWFLVGARGYVPHVQSPRATRRTVGECIDFRLPMTRVDSKPRAAKSMVRFREGWARYGSQPWIAVYYGSGPQVLSLDRPCRTVTTRDRFALVHGDRMRMLQPEELKRVMGFHDTYQLAGVRAEQIMQLGNAVCPPVMRGILEQVA